ncbi:MAG TPA: hypothetical protein VHC91_20530 [Trinickia sp.]|uniref:hypothetical protein n=1 Tax=Trinickia sp. TaxID=2571163 RepID=UPI002B6A96D8|nr:hypothetical protein [Trinickia sp.]HVW52747.1 hypothetical protein [Trinickia sp.]
MSIEKAELRELIRQEMCASITGLREAVQQAALSAVRSELQDLHEIRDEIRTTATDTLYPAQRGEPQVPNPLLPSLDSIAKLTQ